MSVNQPRMPWAAVDAFARAHQLDGVAGIAGATGIDTGQLHTWRRCGGPTIESADRLAVKLGVTPEAIWGARAWDEATAVWIERADAEDAKEREAEMAAAEAKAARKRAQQAAARKRWLDRHPEKREAAREYVREYRAQCSEALAAYRRAYYAANRERLIAAAVERKRRRRAREQAQDQAQDQEVA